MFHATKEECCASMFGTSPCKIYEKGCTLEGDAPTPAEGSSTCIGWHVVSRCNLYTTIFLFFRTYTSINVSTVLPLQDIIKNDGCSDNENYAPAWLMNAQLKAQYFSSTREECCAKFFAGPGRSCKEYPSVCSSEGGPAPTPGGGDPDSTCGGNGWHIVSDDESLFASTSLRVINSKFLNMYAFLIAFAFRTSHPVKDALTTVISLRHG